MARFLLRRLAFGLAVLWAVATLTFALLRVLPGGPFDRERRLPPEVMANIEAKYHLDEPFLAQYARYLKGLASGDLGPSYKYIDRTVADIVADTVPASIFLGVIALALALALCLPLGVAAAAWHDRWIDRACVLLATLGISLPNFILGALLIWIFSLRLGWFQARWGTPGSALLPAVTLGAMPCAQLTYLLRSSLLETLGADFIRTARAKGVRESLVLFKHALRNSLIPVLTLLGPLFAILVAGSFVVEYVFAIPGMGRFFITAVTDRDYPLVMGVTLVYTAILVCANLTVDVLYSVVDPRMRSR
ncbi:MAG TPA: ABC transporter permease [Verrucomicrobiae bacterium]|jgi:oligopeptide transport system permease protein|nr:ABC transporter permease [Verrucomicrobiae bacterium]